MKKHPILITYFSVFFVFLVLFGAWYIGGQKEQQAPSPAQIPRQLEAITVPFEKNNDTTISVGAAKLPEFVFDLSDKKFADILSTAKEKLEDMVSVTILHKAYALDSLEADMKTDKTNKKLFITPTASSGFRPGLYRLSVKLRTLEGEVDIEQDFRWGVLAVNTKKSIYRSGETAQIGIGVLNDRGETQCLTGENKVDDVRMVITDPTGTTTNFSSKDGSITDSGKCGPITVTNEADFKATYQTTTQGVYQITLTAVLSGQERKIQDYFKVDDSVPFDIERTSFPTRIYPKVIYPNTFTITATSDYEGEVTDTVPAFFEIKNVSDKGMLETNGNFTKIKWRVSLKANTPKTFTYFINFPHVSPEFYLLGPIQIGDFSEARQWQIASDAVNSTSGLVAYEDNGGPNTFAKVWTGTAFNTQISMSGVPTDSRWFREVSSPKTGEKIIALIDNTTNDPLMLFTWSGTAWTLDKNIPLTGISAGDATRPFDVAYEELSGDALFLFSDYSTNQLRYYKRVAGVWDAGATVAAASTAGTGFSTFKRWVRLEAQFESDSILAGYLSDSETIGAMIWDGSTNTFGSQLSDAVGVSTATATSDEQPFDIAWESSSGTPMIFWGTTGNLLAQREFSSGSWQAETTVASGFTNDLDWVFAAADPLSSSNNISLILQDNTTCRVRMGVWTGAAASMNGTVPLCPSVTTNNLIETAFEYNSGKAMFVYVVDSADDDDITWLTWTSGGGFTSPTTESMNPAVIEGMQLYSDLNTNSMMLLFHDNATTCDLWAIQWDGTSWSTLGAAVYDNLCASADDNTLPYGFGFDRNLETLAAYRWFANSADLGTNMTVLTSQDTAYTLTSANQAFRLRLLLYYPDSLLSLSLRQYKLQYVDPGTGTCAVPTGGTPSTYTDVPTSGGTTISFNNNGSLADGDNISTPSGSLDPSYQGKIVEYQDYEEANNFTNSRTNMLGDRTAIWDFSLIDNTGYDRIAQTYCFRVARSNDVVLRIGLYPQISTAAVDDVLFQGGTLIQGGTSTNR